MSERNDDVVAAMFDKLDANQEGKICFQEFVTGLSVHPLLLLLLLLRALRGELCCCCVR